MSQRPLRLYEVRDILHAYRNSSREDVKLTEKYIERFATDPVKVHLPYDETERVAAVTLLPETGQELASLIPSLTNKFSIEDLEQHVQSLYEHNPHLCS